MLTSAQAAERVGVAQITIRVWCSSGKLAGADKLGRDWLIPESALDAVTKGKAGRPRKAKDE